MSTVPIFAPDGSLGDIPASQLAAAVKAGAKPGIHITAPDGSPGVIPVDRAADAVKAGAKMVPIEDQPVQHPGFWASLGADLGGLLHPSGLNPYPGMGLDDKAAAASQAYEQDQARKKAGYSLPYRAVAPVAQAIGTNVPGMEQSAAEGDEAGVWGHAAAPVAVIGASEALAHGGPAAVDALRNSPKASIPVRLAARAAETAINQKLVPLRPLANIMTPADAAEATQFKVPGRDFGLQKPAAAPAPFVDPGAPLPEHPGTFPGAPLPATPAPEVLNPALVSPARTLPGMISPEVVRPPAAPIPARPGLQLTGDTPAPEAAAAAAPPEPAAAAPPEALSNKNKIGTSYAAPTAADILSEKLNDALGGRPIQPGVTMRNQATAAAGKLPAGFTATPDSSLLKGYKYDPATQEFDAVLNTGQRFRHGEVSPDQFQAFEDADSKGKAWTDLRNGPGVTPLGKVSADGVLQPRIKPRSVVVDPTTGASEFSDVLEAKQASAQATPTPAPKAKAAAAAASSEGDLTSQLQESVDKVQAQKGGVMTNRDPSELAQRWGVDDKSIIDTDANVRGLSEEESKAYIAKLAKAYKEGQPVPPVMETRNPDNTIHSVDGRHRAIAAQQAGIKQIPVIVRRLQTVQ
jgi:hypothetical protein